MVSGEKGGWSRARARMLLRRLRREESGATAVEFGVIALPFLLLLFGIMSVCLFYFANFAIENAVWQAARAIRTGQLQQGKGAYTGASTDADKKAAFKQALCSYAPTFLDCNSKAVVIVQSNANFSGISEPSCTSDGNVINQSSAAFNAGSGSSVVLVTVCYPWNFGGKLPLFKMGNLNDGSLLMQASVAFRTEPYN